MATQDHWQSQSAALGAFIRTQRQLADLSLREMATMTDVSNAYLSQIERGLRQPSVRVLSAIAQALHVSTDELLAEAGLRGTTPEPAQPDHVCSTAEAIAHDPRLTDEQRRALLGVYRSFAPDDPSSA